MAGSPYKIYGLFFYSFLLFELLESVCNGISRSPSLRGDSYYKEFCSINQSANTRWY